MRSPSIRRGWRSTDTVSLRLVLLAGMPLVIVTIVGFVVYRSYVAPLVVRDSVSSVEIASRSGARLIEEWEHHQSSLIVHAASHPEAIAWDVPGMLSVARGLNESFDSIGAIVFADPEGKVVVDSIRGSGGSVADREYFAGALTGRTVAQIIPAAKTNDAAAVVIATPVWTPVGTVRGVCFGAVLMGQALEEALASLGRGDVISYIVDEAGTIATGPDAGTVLEGTTRPGPLVTGPYVNHLGVEMYGAGTRVGGTGWTVVAEVPASAVASGIRRYNAILLGTVVVGLVVAIAVAIVVATSIQRPVKWLARFAIAIEEGGARPARSDRPPRHAPAELRDLQKRLVTVAATIAAREADLGRVNGELRDALAQKSLLVQEVHHRVRNNLAVVEGMLLLQSGRLEPGSPAATALNDARSRINAMSLVHRQLHDMGSASSVDLSVYVEALLASVEASYGSPSVKLEIDAPSIKIPSELAIPCGLIINELVVNAYKHAFPDGTGTISVTATEVEVGTVSIVVEDDGVGRAGTCERHGKPGMGTQLVTSLVTQIGGTITIEASHGTRTLLRFPIPDDRRRLVSHPGPDSV